MKHGAAVVGCSGRVLVLPHLSGDEGRVSNDHVECAPYCLGDVVRLGEVIKYESRVLSPLGVELRVIGGGRGDG